MRLRGKKSETRYRARLQHNYRPMRECKRCTVISDAMESLYVVEPSALSKDDIYGGKLLWKMSRQLSHK